MQLLRILLCHIAVSRVTHMPLLLPWKLRLCDSRCARVPQMAREIADEQDALIDHGNANEMAGEHHRITR